MKTFLIAISILASAFANASSIEFKFKQDIRTQTVKADVGVSISDENLTAIKYPPLPPLPAPAPYPQPEPVPMPYPSQKVYCGYYADAQVVGYSLFRLFDNKDIGNSVWTENDKYECGQAAELANRVDQNVACAKFHKQNTNVTAYSVYRISDGQDLGKALISDFNTCQRAVLSARSGLICSTYVQNGQTWWSLYNIATNEDLGQSLFSSLEQCQQMY